MQFNQVEIETGNPIWRDNDRRVMKEAYFCQSASRRKAHRWIAKSLKKAMGKTNRIGRIEWRQWLKHLIRILTLLFFTFCDTVSLVNTLKWRPLIKWPSTWDLPKLKVFYGYWYIDIDIDIIFVWNLCR